MGGGDDDVETESLAAEREAHEERKKRKLERHERRAERQRQRGGALERLAENRQNARLNPLWNFVTLLSWISSSWHCLYLRF